MLARKFVVVVIVMEFWVVDAVAAGSPSSYAEAEVAWQRSRDKPQYQAYASKFAEFNNQHHLDEKDGCYALSPGPVKLFLVITHSQGGEFALIERVLSNVDNSKSSCFKRTYEGLRTKVPPFLPFVLQMGMG